MKHGPGLFEDVRNWDETRTRERIGSESSLAQARLAAEESLVTLKNDGILPLNDESRFLGRALAALCG